MRKAMFIFICVTILLLLGLLMVSLTSCGGGGTTGASKTATAYEATAIFGSNQLATQIYLIKEGDDQ